MAKDDNGNGNVSNKVQLAVMAEKLIYIERAVNDIRTNQQTSFVTKEEFAPVKKIVYGLVSIILLAVGGALINLVLAR